MMTQELRTIYRGGRADFLEEHVEEMKSMRVAENCRGKGVASRLMAFLIVEARGSGFQECGPFAEYLDDSNSVFMTLIL